MTEQGFNKKNKRYQDRINIFLADFLADNYSQSNRLIDAMSYSLLSGGKRIRPLLSYATAEALGIDIKRADYIAASVEIIHAYSLIHDDLPAMDDDDVRRGKSTCHVKFDEATAILAGDALQAMAFEVLSLAEVNSAIVVKLIRKLSFSCGAYGMAGGQSLDLESENKDLNKEQMDNIHLLKTGALIAASVEMIGLLYSQDRTKKSKDINDALSHYAYNFGMAFQIIDDVLDIIGDEETIGKPVGSDESNHKSTYPSLMGLESSQKAALEHSQQAVDALSKLPGDSSYLEFLANYLISRQS